jgi:glucose dehydrogenase
MTQVDTCCQVTFCSGQAKGKKRKAICLPDRTASRLYGLSRLSGLLGLSRQEKGTRVAAAAGERKRGKHSGESRKGAGK